MAITFENIYTNTASSNSVTVTISCNAGDLLIGFVGSDQNDTPSISDNGTGNFTTAITATQGGGPSNRIGAGVFYKEAAGDETSVTFDFGTGNTGNLHGTVVVYSGVVTAASGITWSSGFRNQVEYQWGAGSNGNLANNWLRLRWAFRNGQHDAITGVTSTTPSQTNRLDYANSERSAILYEQILTADDSNYETVATTPTTGTANAFWAPLVFVEPSSSAINETFSGAGTSTMAVTATVTVPGTMSADGTSTMTATSTTTVPASFTAAGTSTMSVAGAVTFQETMSASGASTMSTDVKQVVPSSVAGAATITTTPTLIVPASTAGTSSMATTAIVKFAETMTAAGTSTMSVTPKIILGSTMAGAASSQTQGGCVTDEYAQSNQSNSWPMWNGTQAIGQSFVGDGGQLIGARFYGGVFGTPAGVLEARLYAHSGTLGTSSVPTGAALATSLNTVDPQTLDKLGGNNTPIDFFFDGTVTMTNNTNYVIVIGDLTGTIGNRVNLAVDDTSPTHQGNQSNYSGSSWSADSARDVIFSVYSSDPVSTVSGTMSASGQGSMTTDAKVVVPSSAAGTSSLAVSGSQKYIQAATIAGTSSLTTDVKQVVPASASGVGTMSVAATVTITQAASMAGTSTLTVTGSPNIIRTASASGQGSMTTDAKVVVPSSVAGASTMSTVVKQVVGASSAGASTMDTSPTLIVASSHSGASTMSTGVKQVVSASAAGTSSMSVGVKLIVPSSVSGTSTMTTTSDAAIVETFTAAGQGLMSTAATVTVPATASIAGASTMSTGVKQVVGASAAGQGTMAVAGAVTYVVGSSAAGQGSMSTTYNLKPQRYCDQYFINNRNTADVLGFYTYVGQSFEGDGGVLETVSIWATKFGSPTGNITCHVYTHTGVYGTSSARGTLIETATNTFVANDLPTAAAEPGYVKLNFYFGAGNKLAAGEKYTIVLDGVSGNINNRVNVGMDDTSPTHPGNAFNSTSTQAGKDLIFEVTTVEGVTAAGQGSMGVAAVSKFTRTATFVGSGTMAADVGLSLDLSAFGAGSMTVADLILGLPGAVSGQGFMSTTAVVTEPVTVSLEQSIGEVSKLIGTVYLEGEAVSIEGIWNAALTHLGAPIVSSTSETTEEANLLNEVWEQFFEKFLTDHQWNGAKTTIALSQLVDGAGDTVTPPTRWSYAYALPSDFLLGLRVNGMAMQPQTTVLAEVESIKVDGVYTQALMTNQGTAELEYIFDVGSQVTLLKPQTRHACGLLLAAYMAPQFGKSEAEIEGLRRRAELALQDARAVDSQENTPNFFAESPLLSARYRWRGRR